MVSPVMEASMMGTMYFLRVNCAQHGGGTIGGGLISAFLPSYRALDKTVGFFSTLNLINEPTLSKPVEPFP